MFNGKRLSGWMALAVFATVGGAMVAADPAFAKVDVDKLTISGEIRERYEIRTNSAMNINGATGLAQKGNVSYGSHRVRVGVGYDLTPDVSFFAQLQDARSYGSEGQANTATGAALNTTTGIQAVSNTNSNQTGLDLHQGFILVKNILVPGLSLKAGRQEIIYGDHRLFGNFGWSQVGNSFDAVKLMHSTSLVDVDLFWGRIFDSAGIAFQGGNNNSILFPASGTGTQSTANQDIYGAYVTLKPIKNWTIEPYWFLLKDARSYNQTAVLNGQVNANLSGATSAGANAINAAQTQGQTRNTAGLRINGKAAGLDFTAEGAWQFGSIAGTCERAGGTPAVCGSQPGQFYVPASAGGSNRVHINADAFAVKTGYTFDAVPMKPRLGFEFDYASGDQCANGVQANDNNRCGGSHTSMRTFDNMFPTNHFHYGYMDVMAWRNMVNYQIMFDVKPSPVSKLQFNFIWHRLANTADNWYRAGQATYFTSRATNQEASLGRELDVHYWHTFKEKFKFEVGYGHFFTGAYLKKSVGAGLTPYQAITQGGTGQGIVASQTGQGSTVDQNWGYVMGSILF